MAVGIGPDADTQWLQRVGGACNSQYRLITNVIEVETKL